MNSVYIYRDLESRKIRCFAGDAFPGLKKGFVISPFICSKNSFLSIINSHELCFESINSVVYDLLNSEEYRIMPSIFPNSTDKEDYFCEVESIISEIDGDIRKKTIACRRIVEKGKMDIKETFVKLCDNYPSAFVFMFCTPKSGAWIGASPELLLESKDNKLYTYALAGTRRIPSIGDWDEKNILEHKIVSEYLINIFRDYGMTPISTHPSSRCAGNVEHLFQEINAAKNDDLNLTSFLEQLSPTPALCGMPKLESMNRILRLETFPREYYGGFCGDYKSDEDFRFYVILRSFTFDKSHACIYAGGGITCNSNVMSEWEETAAKASGLADCFTECRDCL